MYSTYNMGKILKSNSTFHHEASQKHQVFSPVSDTVLINITSHLPDIVATENTLRREERDKTKKEYNYMHYNSSKGKEDVES